MRLLGGQAAEIDTWGLDGFLDIDGKLLITGIPWEILNKALAEGQSDPLFTRIDYDSDWRVRASPRRCTRRIWILTFHIASRIRG